MSKSLVLAIWSNLDSSHPCFNLNLETLDGSRAQGINLDIRKSQATRLAKPSNFIIFFYRPSVWNISDFVSAEVYQLCNFRKFSLIPDPEDERQNKEWGKFMHFLWYHQRVSTKCTLCVLGYWVFATPSVPYIGCSNILYYGTEGVCHKLKAIFYI
jgi:hypothetical protein